MKNQNASLINEERLILFKRAWETGNSFEKSSFYAKIHDRTARNWRKKGKDLTEKILLGEIEEKDLTKNEKLYVRFYDILENSQLELEIELTDDLKKVGKDRMFVDKDGIERIDKPAIPAATLAVLKRINPAAWRDKESEQVTQINQYVKMEGVKEEVKPDLLAKMQEYQRKSVKSLQDKNNKEGEE